MDGSSSTNLDPKFPETQSSKRRKVVEKTVVTVRIGEISGNLKNEGPPSDLWSWRKYGQKPIKGSPYPRGYYRCSTSKGCSAKKQVERCRTDAAVLIITYTSSHNHPGPDLHNTNQNQQEKEVETQPSGDNHPTTPKQEHPQEQKQEVKQNRPNTTNSDEDSSEDHSFLYLQSPVRCSEDVILNQENSFAENPEKPHSILLDEELVCSCPQLDTFSTTKSEEEENDFFDELEELPIYSSAFTSFMRGSVFDERIPVVPS